MTKANLMEKLTNSAEWKNLLLHQKTMAKISLQKLFNEQPERFNNFSLTVENILFDFSKNHITEETIDLLLQLANAQGLTEKIPALFRGAIVNQTENRPALHTALRQPETNELLLNNKNIIADIHTVKNKMANFSLEVLQGTWRAYTGDRITDIVNIGIGGSDLGPALVVEALAAFNQHKIQSHFVSNMDGQHIHEILKKLHPKNTLFIISSKSFTTQETLHNFKIAREWLHHYYPDPKAFQHHFIAVTWNQLAAHQLGFEPQQIFPIWDWVGGRYSLWSAVGLPIACAIGMDKFNELLAGAYAADLHFQNTDLRHNMPVILALMDIWYSNFFRAKSKAILPYDQMLKRLPAYLQQAEMESNGKSVSQSGSILDYSTAPIVWGDVGTNSQHAFHQLLHQGSQLVPVDFIVAAKKHHPYQEQQQLLLANCLAQAQALAFGQQKTQIYRNLLENGLAKNEANNLAQHQAIPGNRPSNMFILPELTPFHLGFLLAVYEHKIFVQSVIWDINPFDQWGVELGKKLANTILPALQNSEIEINFDSSTTGLIKFIQQNLTASSK